MRLRVALLALFFLAVASSCNQMSGGTLAPGQSAPELEISTLDGVPAKLSDFRGRVVLLHFLASWCAPCIEEVPALNALYRQMQGEDFILLAVGTEDTLEDLQGFIDDHGVEFPIYFDSRNLVRHRYGVTGFPETFLLDKGGKLVLMVDPHTRTPTIRLTGPQNWGSPEMRGALQGLLAE